MWAKKIISRLKCYKTVKTLKTNRKAGPFTFVLVLYWQGKKQSKQQRTVVECLTRVS